MFAKVMREVWHDPPTGLAGGSATLRMMDIDDPKRPSSTRILVWVLAGGVGIYLLASGIIGIVSGN